MSPTQPPTRRKKPARDGILLRYRDADSVYGVSRTTTSRLAEALGLTETQVIHVALAQLARQTLPQYEADAGLLTDAQLKEIDRRVPQGRLHSNEFLIASADGDAYALAGLSYATKFDMGNVKELPWNDEWFRVPPHAPHGQTPRLGVLHPVLLRRARAAYNATKHA